MSNDTMLKILNYSGLYFEVEGDKLTIEYSYYSIAKLTKEETTTFINELITLRDSMS